MGALEFAYDLATLRALTPDFVPVTVAPRAHHFSLGLGLTSRCNFRCPICYYHDAGAPRAARDMPLSLLKSLLDPLPQLASVCIGLEGEPFCHPRLFEALDMVAAHADCLNIVSNGSLVDGEAAERLCRYPLGSLALSIDAGDEVSYRRFRQGGELRVFMKNGARLAGRLGPLVCLHTVVFAENLDSLARLPDVAAEMGVSSISLQQLRPTAGSRQRNVHPATGEKLKEGLDRIVASAERRGIALFFDARFTNRRGMEHLQDLAQNSTSIRLQKCVADTCSQLYAFTSILAEGTLFPCCGDFSPAPIPQHSFDDIFNHEYLQRLRFLHRKQNAPIPPCRACLHEE